MDLDNRTSEIRAPCSEHLFYNQQLVVGEQGSAPQQYSSDMTSQSKNVNRSPEGTSAVITEDGLRNGTCEFEAVVALDCTGASGAVAAEDDHHALSNDGMSDLSNSHLSPPEGCDSTENKCFEEEMNYEVQQAYRIFNSFLVDKHKSITGLFLRPVGRQVARRGAEGVLDRGQAQLKQSMCLQRMKEKFVGQEYESITEFVADFRLMLENCYRYHGVDHWISKQAQKLEILLEQKLTLLSRMLREKTSLAVTSKGRFGSEEERGSGGTSTRRRLAPRSLATMSVGGHESVMVQTLRLEEQQRAKDEKRQRELERKEAEEMSAKEVEDWEQSLLFQASPHPVETLWELPAIGHFLCLAQTALNLPEIIFFELERCLLMPRCSSLLSKIMTSLLSPPQRRATLHRRPALPYRRWESELRQRVVGWYRAIGASRNQVGRAEQLGLCRQFFSILGEASPLEEKPFHLLPFYQRVWVLKGLCDHVYETQKDIQDALLSQPIHECRESILGYDSKENAYIHFPHFCGADLRIYCQSPSTPPAFPLCPIAVKVIEKSPGVDAELSEGVKDEEVECNREGLGDFGSGRAETQSLDREEEKVAQAFKKEGSESGPCDGDSCDDSELNSASSASFPPSGPRRCAKKSQKEHLSRRERGSSSGSTRTIEAETQEPCLSVGEDSYTGRSPARPVSRLSPVTPEELKIPGGHGKPPTSPFSDCSKSKPGVVKAREPGRISGLFSPERAQASKAERLSNKIWTKRKKRKKKRPARVKAEREEPQLAGRTAQAAKSAARRVSTAIKRKDKKKKPRTGKRLELSRTIKDEPPAEPSFKLVCTNLEELRGLISKIEDELDDLESTKKRLGRWYYRREAVKELHSTLIRLLNELSPWEPKLVKAFQRNRLRLKKEFDDYKKHPEYNNFVREEGFSSSSSSSSSDEEKDEEGCLDAKVYSLSDHYRRSEEEDLEVPRGLWKGASTNEMMAESDGPFNHLNPAGGREKGLLLLPRLNPGSSSITSPEDSGLQFKSHLIMSNQSTDSDPTCPSRLQPQASPVLHPTAGLPKGYTPIPTLLAKSVGNKVTLMKRPADFSGLHNKDSHKTVSLPTSVVMNAKAQISSNVLQHTGGPQQTEAHNQPAALSRAAEAKTWKAITKNAFAANCTAPGRPGQPTETESSSTVAMSGQAFVDQAAGESIAQMVMLPSGVIIQKEKEVASPRHQQQASGVQVPVSNVSAPLCMSTNVPGFTIPENKIPVQQVAPLKTARTPRTPGSLGSQEEVANAAGFKGAQIWNPPFSLSNSTVPVSPSGTSPSVSSSSDSDHKQELRTVCIRDSQSILVTTRGGNTGIVKVQSSSDPNAFSPFSMNPVITISPQLKAFLVSKAAQNLGPSAPAQTSCTIPAVTSISGAQTQTPVSTTTKSHDVFAMAGLPPATSGIPTPDPPNTAASTSLAFAKGSSSTVGPPAADKMTPSRQAAGASSTFQPSGAKNAVVPQAEFTNKTGVKRAGPDEISQHAKFILVSPSSLSTISNVALPKSPPSSTGSLPPSGVMFISQPAATFASTCAGGSSPTQALAAGTGGQPQSSSLTHLKHGLRSGQPGGSLKPEAPKLKNMALPSGVQIQLSGRTTMIGQTIGALSLSPSPKSTAGSVCGTGRPAAVATAPSTAVSSSTISSSSTQHGSQQQQQQQVVPSFTTICQPGSSASSSSSSAPAAPAVGDDLGPAQNKLLIKSPAQVTSAAQGAPGLAPPPPPPPPPALAPQPSHATAPSKTPISASPAATANAQFSTSSTGAIQQRIVINTSAPLAAGTQILFNNARFVVPPQGLGPGSHVLIISSPAPHQQVPPASVSSTGVAAAAAAAAPPQRATAPQAPVSPRSPVRLPAAPAAGYPFVACAAATVTPSLRSTATDCMGSAVLPAKTNGSFAPPPVLTPTLVSFPSRLGAPGLIPPVANSVPVSNPALASKMSPARTPAGAECSPAVAHSSPGMSAPVSSLPVVSSPLAPASSVIARTPSLLPSLPAQQVACVTTPGPVMQLQQGAAAATAASSIHPLSHGPLHIRLDNNLGPAAIQAMLAGTKTQVPPTVAIPSIPGGASRMQTLPIATVPPIGSIVHTFETAPLVAAPSSNSTILMTSAQPITSLQTNLTDTPGLADQALGKHSLETSSKGIYANVASRLLISPDGAVLNTVQCAELTGCSGTKDSRVVLHNSSTGELRTHGSDLQPSQPEKLRPCQH